MPPKKKVSPHAVAAKAKAKAKALGGGGTGEGKVKEKWKTKEVGGGLLAWDPYGYKTLERYATEEEHTEFVKKKGYRRVNYGGSTAKAIWFKTVGGTYEAGFAESRPWIVTVEVSITEDSPLVNFEVEGFKGEAGYSDGVIVKQNENGAYGIGRDLIDKLQPKWKENG